MRIIVAVLMIALGVSLGAWSAYTLYQRITSLEAELARTRVAAASGRTDESLAESLSRIDRARMRSDDEWTRLRAEYRTTQAVVDALQERGRAQEFLNRTQVETDRRQDEQLRRLGAR